MEQTQTIYQISSPSYMGVVQAPQNNYNGNIKDHWSQITVTNKIMKKFKILWELPNCDPETLREQMMLEKWHAPTCSMEGCHKSSICKKNKQTILAMKHNKVKHNKKTVILLDSPSIKILTAITLHRLLSWSLCCIQLQKAISWCVVCKGHPLCQADIWL